jgi:hypothetical protein
MLTTLGLCFSARSAKSGRLPGAAGAKAGEAASITTAISLLICIIVITKKPLASYEHLSGPTNVLMALLERCMAQMLPNCEEIKPRGW